MKDSYSFDLTDDGLAESYRRHRAAYVRIFDRLGLDYVVVAATSGAMGGSASEEFLAVAPNGEDTFVQSPGGYAANVEAVTTPAPPARPLDGLPEAQAHHTPGTPTIGSLVEFLNGADGPGQGLGRTFTAADTLKNVLVKTRQPGQQEWTLLGVGVPGDREVDMKRLEAALEPAEVALLDEADFTRHPFLVKGYIGPAALAANGCATWSTPGWSPAPPGSPAPTSPTTTWSTWSPGATSPRTAPSRRPRCVRVTRPRTAAARCRRPAASRSGTCSSSAACTPTPPG
jgi:prolyl-tRNA synthetase